MNDISVLAADVSLALRCSEIEAKKEKTVPENVSINKYRTKFMSDRDRILYSKAFLRLSGKTQVYTPSKGDHQRTRLTHTLEVSQIARTISKALCMDCDLTEAIALGHDIGHTPFGHAGERMLHEIMSPPNCINAQIPKTTSIYNLSTKSELLSESIKNKFGFKHNFQSVRCAIEDIELRDSKYGLNLSNYTLWGIMNHSGKEYKEGKVSTDFLKPAFYDKYEKYCSRLDGKPAWSFEALIVREADEIAQMHHDLEDSIRSKAISFSKVIDLVSRLSSLMKETDKELFLQIENEVKDTKHNVPKERFISVISKIVINSLVTCLVEASEENLKALLKEYNNSDIIKSLDPEEDKIKKVISYDQYGESGNQDIVNSFKESMSKTVLYTYDVQRSDSKGKYIIKNLFEAYYTNPQQLSDSVIRNLHKYYIHGDNAAYRTNIGELRSEVEDEIKKFRTYKSNYEDTEKDIFLMRTICDYIAGMTDNFAISEYEKLYG